MASRAVLRATPYSAANARSDGSLAPGGKSPEAIALRNSLATRRLGSCVPPPGGSENCSRRLDCGQRTCLHRNSVHWLKPLYPESVITDVSNRFS